MRSVVVAGVVLVGLMCQRAYGDSQLEPLESPEPPRVESYRGTALSADGVALGLVAAGIATDGKVLSLLGVSTYVLASPLGHLSHRRYGRAAASVAMRVGLPLLGALIGDGMSRDCAGDCVDLPAGMFVAIGAGVVTASAIDALFLARGDARSSSSRSQTWTPVAAPTRGGVALGISGAF
jgi:hypothetical protein